MTTRRIVLQNMNQEHWSWMACPDLNRVSRAGKETVAELGEAIARIESKRNAGSFESIPTRVAAA